MLGITPVVLTMLECNTRAGEWGHLGRYEAAKQKVGSSLRFAFRAAGKDASWRARTAGHAKCCDGKSGEPHIAIACRVEDKGMMRMRGCHPFGDRAISQMKVDKIIVARRVLELLPPSSVAVRTAGGFARCCGCYIVLVEVDLHDQIGRTHRVALPFQFSCALWMLAC